jgi:hypothetical protein
MSPFGHFKQISEKKQLSTYGINSGISVAKKHIII